MTALPTLVLHPVTAAAIANGITEFAGLGDVDFTCRTCGGRGSVRTYPRCANGNRSRVPCPDCTSGRVVPEAGTYVLATTSQRPHPDPEVDEFGIANFEVWESIVGWRMGRKDVNETLTVELGMVLGTVRFEPLPVVDEPIDGEHILSVGDRLHLNVGKQMQDGLYVQAGPNITASLPFGDWSSAGRFTDFTPTIDPGPTGPRYGTEAARKAARSLACPFPYEAPDRPCFTTIDLVAA